MKIEGVMPDQELLLLQETIRTLFRYDAEQGRLFWKDGDREGKDASFKTPEWTEKTLFVRVFPGGKRTRVSGIKVRVDTIIWWLETGEWREEGLIHLNQKFNDCRITNLSLQKPKEPTKEFLSLMKSLFFYDRNSGLLLWGKGINKGAEAGFLSNKDGVFKKIVRIQIEEDRFAPPTDIRVDSIVWFLVRGRWVPNGFVHKNGIANDCSLMNLSKPKPRKRKHA